MRKIKQRERLEIDILAVCLGLFDERGKLIVGGLESNGVVIYRVESM